MAETYTPERAIELVERVHDQTATRRIRMDADYRQQRSDPYNTNTDADNAEVGSDYKSFTSTIAAAFVRKTVSILQQAKLLVTVPYGRSMRPQQELYDIKERFAYGLLDQTSEELRKLINVDVQDQQAWFSPVRGWVCGLALLRNTEDGATFPMITPWDPINTYWQVGQGGLTWACYRIRMSLADIRAEWPGAAVLGDDEEERLVYNFWTRTQNAVFTEDHVMLKRWTLHGDTSVPVDIVPVATQPNIWSGDLDDTAKDYGESILATNRSVYNHISEVMSITLDLLQYSRDPGAVAFTDEEDTEFEDNPQRSKQVSYMGREDKFQPLNPPETTKDAIQFATLALNMIQRGDLPFTSYGEINFALSGYAITQLNQQMLTVIGPQTKAIARWYEAALNRLVDQYTSGRFNAMEVRGFGNNRDYMQMTVPYLALRNLPPLKVQLVAELPQDDTAKLAAAGAAREFLPDEWLMENYLKLPDVHQVMRQLKLQQAERGHPMAVMLELARAALESGRPDLAQVYMAQLQSFMLQSQLQGAQVGVEQPGATAGLPPTALPFVAAQGGILPPPTAPTGEEGRFGFERNR